MRLEDLNVEMSSVQACICLMELEGDDIAYSSIIWVQHDLKVHREHVFADNTIGFEVVVLSHYFFVCTASWIVLYVMTFISLIVLKACKCARICLMGLNAIELDIWSWMDPWWSSNLCKGWIAWKIFLCRVVNLQAQSHDVTGIHHNLSFVWLLSKYMNFRYFSLM